MLILTLNLNYYVDKHGSWDQRKLLIARALEEHKPDVVLLQAVAAMESLYDGKDQARQLCDMVRGYSSHFFVEAQQQANGQRQGSAVIARKPIYENTVVALTLIPDTEDNNKRVVIRSSFETPAGIFEVYNAHFSWVEQQASTNVLETLDFVQKGRGYAVLGGDLNTLQDSPAFQPFRQHGLADVWEKLHPDDPGHTFEADQPSLRIDYFWVTDALVPSLRRVERILPPADSSVRLSDHFGLLLDLDWPS